MFRPLDEAALQRLDDDSLIECMRKARESGHPSQWLFVREHACCGGDVAELERTFGTSAAATERRVRALFGDS